MDAGCCSKSSPEWLGDGLISISSPPGTVGRRGWRGSTKGRGRLSSIVWSSEKGLSHWRELPAVS